MVEQMLIFLLQDVRIQLSFWKAIGVQMMVKVGKAEMYTLYLYNKQFDSTP
jgi:hypothetical protein